MKIIPLLWKKNVPKFKMLQAILHLTHYSVHPLMLLLALLTMPVLYYVKVFLPPFWFALVVFGMILATSGPSTMYMISQHYIGNKIRKQILLIPAMMLIGTGLAVNNGKAVIEALFKMSSPFHRTPKKGSRSANSYKLIKDIICLIEIFIGIYCLISFQMFLGFTNFLVSPFLMLYASGFLFVGIISIIHFRRPDLIDAKVRIPLNSAKS